MTMVEALKPIGEFTGQTLEWTQLDSSSEYELRSGDVVVAVLHGPSRYRFRAVGESSDEEWHFDALPWRVKIRASTSKIEGPKLTSAWFWQDRWLLRCKSGRRYRWSDFRSRFSEEAGEPLIQFKARSALFQSQGEVRVEARAASNPDLSLLTLLGWYLVILDSFPDEPVRY